MKSEQRRRWVPAVAVSAAVGVAALGGGIAANADSDLPEKTAEEILEMAAVQPDDSFSGQFEVSFALGLPQLPVSETGGPGHGGGTGSTDGGQDDGPGQAALAEAFALLSGTHEARVFTDGRERSRVQVFDGTEEFNVVRNGDEVWAYDSTEDTATRAVVPEDADQNHLMGGGASPGQVPTPEQLAAQVLAALDPSTQVTVGQDTRVAGLDAYTLRLDPRTDDTLVEGVTLAVDAATGTPLSVQIDAVGQEVPAVSVGFTTFSPETPDASLFEFTPPDDAEVRDLGVKNATAKQDGETGHGSRAPGAETAVGSGWDAVVVIPADEVPEDLAASPLVDQYATSTPSGRVLSTPLATILLADDGRIFAGPVPLEGLLDVAETE